MSTALQTPEVTLTEPPEMPEMDAASVLLLEDDANVRIVLTWHLVPANIRSASSRYDIASYVSRVAGVTIEQAAGRVHTLLGLGVIFPDGTTDAQVAAFLRAKGQARLTGAQGYDAATVARNYIVTLSAAALRQFIHQAAPLQARALDWDDTNDTDEE